MESQISGVIGLHTGRIVHYLGGIYTGQALELIAQLVENGIDSLLELQAAKHHHGELKVIVELHPDAIYVTDNGTGMVDDILPADRVMMDEFPQRISEGKLPYNADLRKFISNVSRHSLVWMMSNIGFSSKIGEHDKQRGVRGIGFQGVYSLGKAVKVLTRPTFAFAQERWPGIEDHDIQTWELIPPSAAMLSNPVPNLGYSIGIADKPLRDPFNNVLRSGTMVEIKDLHSGVSDQLSPGALQTYLSNRFGEDVRERNIKIIIIDKTTAAGRKVQGGRQLFVTPPEYKGVPIIDKTLHLGRGEHPFEIKLFFNTRSKGAQPVMLRRMGSAVNTLMSMKEFSHAPWTLLSGYVEFPQLPDDETNWDTSKTNLRPTPHLKTWIKKLQGLETELEEAIARVRDSFAQRELQEYTRAAADAVMLALSDVTSFSDLVLKPSKKPLKKGKVQEPEVEVVIVNQHERRAKIQGMTLYLHPKRGQVKLVDVVGGRFSFGKLPAGHYMLRLSVPDNVTIHGEVERSFELTRDDLSYRITYKVTTTEAEPEPRAPMPKVIPVFDDFGAPWPLYENYLHVGQIRFNIAADPIPEILGKDRAKMDLVFADRMASALTEYCLSGPPEFLFQERSRLFIAILRHLGRM